MSVKDLIDKVNRNVGGSLNWQQILEEINNEHKQATTTEGRVALLSLHKTFMDTVEGQLPAGADVEKFRKARQYAYNQLITRECLVGGSVCTESLYEITQRELEAGRMEPTHSFITLAVDAMAAPHYSHEQLLMQEAKLQAQQSKSTLRKKIAQIFGK